MSGANIKIGASSSQFQKEMKEVTRQLKLVSSECGVASTKAKLFGTTQDQLAVKHKELTAKLNAQNTMLKLHQDRVKGITSDIEKEKQKREELGKKLDEAKKKYEEVSKATGKDSEESKKLKEEKDKLQLAYERTTTNIENYNKKLDDSIIKMNNTEKNILQNQKAIEDLNKEIEELSKEISNSKIEKLGENLDKAGDNAINLGKKMSVVSAGITGVGTASIAAFKEVDEGVENVVKATGATGEAAEELEASYKKLASSINEDFGSIGSALGEANTRFAFTGETLEECTRKFLEFARINNTDATKAIQLVSRAMGDAGIPGEEYGVVLDYLTVAAQKSGISIDKLTELCTKYGAPMRALGMDTKESIAIFSAWELAGVNTEIAFSGMKTAIGNWGKAGKDARVEFKKTLDQIASCPDIATATTKAIEVFGQKAGPDLADAIKGGRFEYSEFLEALESSQGTVSNTFNELQDGTDKAAVAINATKVAGAELGEAVLKAATPAIEGFSKAIQGLTGWFTGLSPEQQQIIVNIGGLIAAIGPAFILVGSFSKGISNVVKGYQSMKTFGSKAIEMMNVFKGAQATLNFVMALNPITLVIVGLIALAAVFVVLYNKCEWFRNGVNNVWEKITNIFFTFDNFLKGVFTTDWTESFGVFGNVINAFFKNMSNIWESIKRIFTGIIDFVAGVFTGDWSRAWEGVKNIFGGIMDGLGAVIKAPLNAVIGLINMAIGQINKISFTAPDWIPFVGGKHFGVNLPKINYLYEGGIITSPTFINPTTVVGDAYKGRGRQAEAVIPLDKMYKKIKEIVNNEVGEREIILYTTNTFIVDGQELEKKTVKKVLKTINKSTKNYKKKKGENAYA